MNGEAAALLQGRKIALLGLGVENRALAQFLHAQGVPFAVCDARPEVSDGGDDWHASAWHLGADYFDHLADYDLIFRTPGISILHPHLRRAREGGAPSLTPRGWSRALFHRVRDPRLAALSSTRPTLGTFHKKP